MRRRAGRGAGGGGPAETPIHPFRCLRRAPSFDFSLIFKHHHQGGARKKTFWWGGRVLLEVVPAEVAAPVGSFVQG